MGLTVRLFLCLSLLVSAQCQSALAETNSSEQQELYLDAMHSLSEGRSDEASDALMQLIEQEPQHAGAWLDLAIIQCELGHGAEAERLFQAIESRFSPPPGIREVINSQRQRGCRAWTANNQWTATISRGYDNNVNQGASNPNFSIGSGSTRMDLQLHPDFLPQSDQYSLLSAEYFRDLSPNGSVGFVQLRARENDSLTRYNMTSLRVGAEVPWRIGTWRVRGFGGIGVFTLGNHLYQKQLQAQAKLSPGIALPERYKFNILTGVTRLQYVTLANYDSNMLELSGLLTYRGRAAQVQASAGYVNDRGGTARLGGDRHGWAANLQTQFLVGEGWLAELGWSHQRWISESAYSPGLIDQIRRQNTQLLRASLTIPVKSDQAFQVELRKVRNDENISIFQYNSYLLQVGWQWKKF